MAERKYPTVPTGRDQSVVQTAPDVCPNGHRLKYPNVNVGYLPCSCDGGRGHQFWTCWTCREHIYDPPHTPPEGPPRQGSLYDG